MSQAKIFKPLFVTILAGYLCASPAWAAGPSLTAGSVSGQAGTSVDLPLSFDPAGNSVASLQFTFTLPSGLTETSYAAGSIVGAAGKSISASQSGNNWTVIVFGLNQNTISAGDLMT